MRRFAPDLCRIGFAPGVAAVGMCGEVERFARGLDGFRRIRPCQAYAGEGHQKFDSQKAESACDGMQ